MARLLRPKDQPYKLKERLTALPAEKYMEVMAGLRARFDRNRLSAVLNDTTIDLTLWEGRVIADILGVEVDRVINNKAPLS